MHVVAAGMWRTVPPCPGRFQLRLSARRCSQKSAMASRGSTCVLPISRHVACARGSCRQAASLILVAACRPASAAACFVCEDRAAAYAVLFKNIQLLRLTIQESGSRCHNLRYSLRLLQRCRATSDQSLQPMQLLLHVPADAYAPSHGTSSW